MPRGQYPRKKKSDSDVNPIVMTTGAITTVSRDSFAHLTWFAKQLNDQEQNLIVANSQGLAGALRTFGQSSLEIGRFLANVQAVLEPKKIFGKFLREFHFKRRTAYRTIARFKNAKALPEPILEQAMVRGLDIGGEDESKPFGVYDDAIKRLPPPPAPTPEQAAAYVAQIEDMRRKQVAHRDGGTHESTEVQPIDPKLAMKEVYAVFNNRFEKLGTHYKTREKFVKTLCGMFLQKLGVSQAVSLAPEGIPTDFLPAKRGRPALTTGQIGAA